MTLIAPTSESLPGPSAPPAVDFARLVQQSPDAIVVTDEESRYLEANAAAVSLTGYTRDELLRMTVKDLTFAPDHAAADERFEQLKRTGRLRVERRVRRKDGSAISVDVHAVALGDGTYLAVLRDISERVAAAAAVQRSVEAYRTLVDLCHAAVLSVGPDGRIRSWNPAAEALFGYPAAEAIGMDVTRLMPERHQLAATAGFARHVASPPERPYTRLLYTEALRKDGREVPVELSLGVGRHGGDCLFTAVIRDMSEQREVVERLNDALQRLQFHIQRMPLAYIVWGIDFRVVEWNPAAERIFGFPREEALGRHAYDLIVPRDAKPTVDTIWTDLLHGDTSSYSINANVRKDGSRLRCEWFNTPLRDSAGRIRGIASMAMDVSEREAVEARLRDAQKLESLGVLAGGVAHDFNSSLMVILGNAALLRSVKGLPPRAVEFIELIEQAGARADELIKHLLAYARTGRHSPQPTRLDVVIHDALMLVRSSIGKKHDLQLELADDLPTIMADRNQLAQIILNLCLNARDAMRPGGVIRVSTCSTRLSTADAARCVPPNAKAGRYVELAVVDQGCGMDESTVQRMFDPFFTTKPDGHGLGMAAVLGILRQHNAFARVDSSPGGGTGIHVYFPEEQPVPVDPQPELEPRRRTKLRDSLRPRRRGQR